MKKGKRDRLFLLPLFLFTILLGVACWSIADIAKANTMTADPKTADSAAASTDSETGMQPPQAADSSKNNTSASKAVSGSKSITGSKNVASSKSSVKPEADSSSQTASSDASEPLVSVQNAAAPSGRYYLAMNNILQRPELPTGCEATALTIVLNHMGFSVDKCEIVDRYLPKTSAQDSLNTHFIGDPYSTSGLGCYAPVIVQTADRYLSDAGSNVKAKSLTGSTPNTLYRYVSQNTPVICWATIGMIDTQVSATWAAADTGETVNFMENEHCTVLVGYNTDDETVTLNDPWSGIVTFPMSLFEKRYHQLGNQAVILT